MARPSTRARCSSAQNRVMGTNSSKPRTVSHPCAGFLQASPTYLPYPYRTRGAIYSPQRPVASHARERCHTHTGQGALSVSGLSRLLSAPAHTVSVPLSHTRHACPAPGVSLSADCTGALHRARTRYGTRALSTLHTTRGRGEVDIRGRRVARLLHRTHTRTPRSAAHVHKSKRTVSARIHLRRELRAAHGLPPRRRASAARVARVRRRAEVYP